MIRSSRAAVALGLTVLLAPVGAAAPAAAEPAGPCAPLAFEGADYTVCAFDARQDEIRVAWKAPDGAPYGGFDRLAEALKAQGRELRFAMNGGMFGADLAPVGLFVENGRQLHKADVRDGDSNFHMKPNGVFFIGDDGVAGVMETSRFLGLGPVARFATQSGPMLVIDGRIHPKIRPDGTSAKIRDGVGVRDGAIVLFAISEQPVTFYAFARLFRDALGCANALFLDGSVSSLFAPGLKRDDALSPLGPLIAISAKALP